MKRVSILFTAAAMIAACGESPTTPDGLAPQFATTISPNANKVTVTGLDDLLNIDELTITPVGQSGRLKFEGQQHGAFNMSASDPAFDIVDGTLIAGFHFNVDASLTGSGQGWITVLDGDENVAWEGIWQGTSVNGVNEGEVVTQGRGGFEGMTLKWSFIEIDPDALPDIVPADMNHFYFEGVILGA